MPNIDLSSIGHLLEGVIEQDPMTDAFVLRTVDEKGKDVTIELGALLAKFVGKEVRLTIASIETLERIGRMVEQRGGDSVLGVQPEDLPGMYRVRRKAEPESH